VWWMLCAITVQWYIAPAAKPFINCHPDSLLASLLPTWAMLCCCCFSPHRSVVFWKSTYPSGYYPQKPVSGGAILTKTRFWKSKQALCYFEVPYLRLEYFVKYTFRLNYIYGLTYNLHTHARAHFPYIHAYRNSPDFISVYLFRILGLWTVFQQQFHKIVNTFQPLFK
jgi:hypothetical protein